MFVEIHTPTLKMSLLVVFCVHFTGVSLKPLKLLVRSLLRLLVSPSSLLLLLLPLLLASLLLSLLLLLLLLGETLVLLGTLRCAARFIQNQALLVLQGLVPGRSPVAPRELYPVGMDSSYPLGQRVQGQAFWRPLPALHDCSEVRVRESTVRVRV